ncbi:hypothetical protein [Oscillatoria sp. FACHB-1406]|uniref:hypothetical protein n=1 Tax=Oscillatoria sp. FACHB-1406 TaxID=2692846 RepID=UPI001685323B|nr:hypothetical protein [Oscillatoria sp. FACHB-1406]MBD2576539.1 hypothetical protein [Oscillatoria sp. FACHB-1406]
MDRKLQNRRDEWLKLSTEELNGIGDLYGSYMYAQIEKYAEFKLAQSRLTDLDTETNQKFPKWAIFLVWVFLTALGLTIFTVLPNIILGKQGKSDSFIVFSQSIFGTFLAFIAHFAISSFIAGMLTRNQHLTALKQLKEEMSNASIQQIRNLFISYQIIDLQKTEKAYAKFPPIFVVLPAFIFTLAEIVALFVILTGGDASLNPIILLVATLLPACLLWGIAYITAYYQKVPHQNAVLKSIYIQKVNGINLIYDRYNKSKLFFDMNEEIQVYIDTMESLLFNDIEEKEKTIEYVLECQRRKDNRGNTLIQLDGQIRFYRETLQFIKNESSKLTHNIETSKYSDLSDNDSRQRNIQPDGEGYTPFKEQVYNEKIIKKHDYKSLTIERRVNFLIESCENKIKQLEKSYEEMQKITFSE